MGTPQAVGTVYVVIIGSPEGDLPTLTIWTSEEAAQADRRETMVHHLVDYLGEDDADAAEIKAELEALSDEELLVRWDEEIMDFPIEIERHGLFAR